MSAETEPPRLPEGELAQGETLGQHVTHVPRPGGPR
jgi:hypothetical protein